MFYIIEINFQFLVGSIYQLDFLYNLSVYLFIFQVGSFEYFMKDGWGFILGKDYIVGSDGSVNIYFMDFLNFKGIFYLGFIIL